MHQAYGTASSAAAPYMGSSTSSPFYGSSSYPYATLGPSRGLNSSCKSSGSYYDTNVINYYYKLVPGYIAAPYGSPASAFGATSAQAGQYSPYTSAYSSTGSGAASFAQGFSQVIVRTYLESTVFKGLF